MVSPPLKILLAENVLDEYVFGIVEDASIKFIADVVDHERPTAARYCAEDVEKKLFTAFHASADVVENDRPVDAKYAADVVEKKLLTAFHALADVVENERPACVKYTALVVENAFAMR